MRLRRKPWIDEAIKAYTSFVRLHPGEECKGHWRELFENPNVPLWVELGTGKGDFISRMAELHKDVNFIGIEIQLGVLYYAAKKCAAAEFFINFCDPWPKKRHAKRRLTHRAFLDRYARLLATGGEIHFKSDNEGLFNFTLQEFKERNWELSEVTYDLHHSDIINEALTEYETKFSAKGQSIFHCVAKRPMEVHCHQEG